MSTGGPPASPNGERGFTYVEILVALGIVAIGFLGALATVVQADRMASAAEEDGLATLSVDQRLNQIRLLEWSEITSTTGLPSKVWTASPVAMAGIPLTQETITVSGYDVPTAKTLEAVWNGSSENTLQPIVDVDSGMTVQPTDGGSSGINASFTGTGPELSTASAVKVVVTITWTGRRSGQQQTRSGVTVISRGGISKSDLP